MNTKIKTRFFCQQGREKFSPHSEKHLNFSGSMWKAVGQYYDQICATLFSAENKEPKT
jgi:hypothetical protein